MNYNQKVSVECSQQCLICPSLNKQLRMQKSDYEFEIKKIKQDKSTEKALYEVHLQKQIRKWQQMYQKLKLTEQQQNYNWIKKYDCQRQQYQKNIAGIIEKQTAIRLKQVSQLNQSHEKLVQNIKARYQTKISDDNKKYVVQKELLVSKYEADNLKLIADHQQYTFNLKKSHAMFVSQTTKSYESKVHGLQSQLKKQEELHTKTKQQHKQQQSKLYQQLFQHKRHESQLAATIQEQASRIDSLLRAAQSVKQSHLKQIARKCEEYRQLQYSQHRSLSQLKQNMHEQIRAYQQQRYNDCQKYQQIIDKIQQTRSTQKQLYLQNIDDIRNTIQNRMSRAQDIAQIEQIKEKLLKKTAQWQLMFDQVKWYRLQLQNKQQTYNKIFVPLTSNTNTSNQNIVGKRKQFKLRRQGRSVTTVREILQSMNSNGSGSNAGETKKAPTPIIPRPKVL